MYGCECLDGNGVGGGVNARRFGLIRFVAIVISLDGHFLFSCWILLSMLCSLLVNVGLLEQYNYPFSFREFSANNGHGYSSPISLCLCRLIDASSH